jgi:S1-C subfamily serine protease
VRIQACNSLYYKSSGQNICFPLISMKLPSSAVKTLLGLGIIAILTGSAVVSGPAPERSLANREAHLRAITVRVISGKKGIGSGTLIAVDRGSYRVVTNRHVLPQHLQSLAVQTSDLKVHEVRVLATAQPQELGLDLALLEFVAGNDIYVTARLATALPKVGDELMAAGFPHGSKETDKPSIDRGQVFYLPPRPLADGYQIGHRANVQKGMSGGPAINSQGELLGINGIHAQPLWEAAETYADGTEVEEPLQSQIPAVSWAIPVQRLAELGGQP